MAPYPFVLVSPATRGLSLALTRHYLQHTRLPVYATYRPATADAHTAHAAILSAFSSRDHVDPARLTVLPLDLTSEPSIRAAADALSALLPPADAQPYIHTAFFTGGVLCRPERTPADLNADDIHTTFQINTFAHLLLIKHFARFLPPRGSGARPPRLAKWVHVSARVGSISDNHSGGWYAYRASKAALNQVVRTFDTHLCATRVPAICVGVHPGTVKTALSRPFWHRVKEGRLFEPDVAAQKLAGVVEALDGGARGRVWDWAGKEVMP